MTHHVYTFWHDRTPLYVGCTGNLRQRMAAHHGSAHDVRANWISVVPFEDEDEAFGAEAERIASLRPRFNTLGNPARMSVAARYEAWESAERYRLGLRFPFCDWPTSAVTRKRESLRQLAAKYKAEAGAA